MRHDSKDAEKLREAGWQQVKANYCPSDDPQLAIFTILDFNISCRHIFIF